MLHNAVAGGETSLTANTSWLGLSTHYLYGTLAFHILNVVLILKILSEFQLFDDSLLKIIRFDFVLLSSACSLSNESF